MDKDIAEQWALELESGKYEQGQNFLSRDGRFCCLGVLCEMAAEDGQVTKVSHRSFVIYGQQKHTDVAPREVMAWSGLRTKAGDLPGEKDQWLAKLNDDGRTFAEIAQIIRANAENL